MSSTATTTPTSAPARQAKGQSPATPPAAGAQGPSSTPAPDGAAKGEGKTSILGDLQDPPAEQKPEGDRSQKGKGEGAADSQDGTTSEPAKLEIKLPEDIKVDDAKLEEYRAAFSEMGVTDGELASKLVAADFKRQAAWAEAQEAAWDKQGDTWAEQLEADADFGGDKLPKTVLDAKRFLRKFGGEPAAKAIAALGIGNHPELVKVFARAGSTLREDDSDPGKGDRPAPELTQHDIARQTYPSMFNTDGSPKQF